MFFAESVCQDSCVAVVSRLIRFAARFNQKKQTRLCGSSASFHVKHHSQMRALTRPHFNHLIRIYLHTSPADQRSLGSALLLCRLPSAASPPINLFENEGLNGTAGHFGKYPSFIGDRYGSDLVLPVMCA